MKLSHLILTAVLLFLGNFAAHAGSRRNPGPTRPDALGTHKVGHLAASATDSRRERTLHYDMWYPVSPVQPGLATTVHDLGEYILLRNTVLFPSMRALENAPASSDGPFPLIVYSHSGGGTRWEAFDLCELLASHGYVVISADHPGSGWAGDYANGSVLLQGDREDPLKAYRLRGPDCSFLIDTALARNLRRGDVLQGRINPARIGGMGWSLGGFSMMALAGGYQDFHGDSRLKAMVLLSPSTWLQTPVELERITIPTVVLTGTGDVYNLPDLTDAFGRFSGPHLMATLHGINHGQFDARHLVDAYFQSSSQPQDVLDFFDSLGGFLSPEEQAARTEYRRLTALYTVAGFNRWLKASASADAWLTPEYAESHEPGIAQVRRGVFPDLNGNDIPDNRDLAEGTSRDINRNGIPDEVDGPVLRVRAGATGNGTGGSWRNAVPDLNRAMALAASSRGRIREIWVAAGTYVPGGPERSNFSCFQLRNVALYGGFAGTESRRAQRDPAQHETVLSGDLNGDDLPGFINRGDNAYRVIYTLASDRTTLLDGFTIRGAFGDTYGAGVLLLSSGTVSNCVITDNASGFGGGLSSWYGTATAVRDCVFTGNAGLYGGALCLTEGSLSVTGCHFENNQAGGPGVGQGSGGAVFQYLNAHLSLVNCVLTGNQANAGGAIGAWNLNSPGSLTALNCLFYSNTAGDFDDIPGSGGLMWLDTGIDAVFTNVTSFGNGPADQQPWLIPGNLTILNSIVHDGVDWLTGEATVQYSNIEGGFAGMGNRDADPGFRDPASGDFSLTAGSPCIDKGKTTLLPFDWLDLDRDRNFLERTPVDLSGQKRFQGAAVDMGAFEAR